MGLKIAYMMSRFPKVTETFVLYEILELEKLGAVVEIFPLIRQRESMMHAEAARLVERAFYVSVLSPAVIGAQFYWLAKSPLRYLKTWWNVLRGNAASPKFLARALVVMLLAAHFARRMQALEIAHIHAHWATHPALGAYIIHQLTGIPYSFTAHAHDIYVERSMLAEKIRGADFVVTISQYNRQFLRDLYGDALAEKINVVHCGIDPEVFQPRPDAKPPGPFTIICVASLEEKKGHPYLIAACEQLKTRGLDFRCLLVGDGDDRPQIEALIARSGLGDRITLLGRQPRQRVTELLAEADVMVLPSIVTDSGRKEGIPVALMEALATEMPVVATRISGIPELIEDGQTGLLVPERSGDALAEALIRLHNDPQLGRMLGKRGREKVLREFDLRQNARELYALFAGEPAVPAQVREPLP